MYSPFSIRNITPVVKNLIIINVMVFILEMMLRSRLDLYHYLSNHYFQSSDFKPYQLVTCMFVHFGPGHLIGNMLGLFFLGPMLENVWGAKKFLIFYLVTGIGANLSDEVFLWFKFHSHIEYYRDLYENSRDHQISEQAYSMMQRIKDSYVSGGASGAVYGIIMGAALLFPNTEVYLYMAIPVKLKYVAIFLGVGQFILEMQNSSGDRVNHIAHLAGMAFAFVLIMIWKKDRRNFY